jgi:hypothetical protein
MTRAAGRSLPGCEDTAIGWIDPCCPDWVVEQHLPEISLLFGRPVTRIYSAILLSRQRYLSISSWNYQLFYAPDLLVDKAAQLNRTVALGRRPGAKREQKNQNYARLP